MSLIVSCISGEKVTSDVLDEIIKNTADILDKEAYATVYLYDKSSVSKMVTLRSKLEYWGFIGDLLGYPIKLILDYADAKIQGLTQLSIKDYMKGKHDLSSNSEYIIINHVGDALIFE